MWIILACLAVILAALVFEFRIHRPDRIVLYESRGRVRQRTFRFYPRHFSLAVPATVQSLFPEIEAEAKGKINVRIRLAVTVAPSTSHLSELIRVGGWHEDAVTRAAGELELKLQASVREFAEKFEIEELSAEQLTASLEEKMKASIAALGLDLISIHVQAMDPTDEEIAEAVRQRESDRIHEQTAVAGHKARVAEARAKVDSDEKIAVSDHHLAMKKLELKQAEEQGEAELARRRVEEELNLRRMQLELDKAEIELIKDNPELVLLTPQAARLAEASQSLRNAKTVVSLSANDLTEGSPIAGLLNSLLQKFGQGNPRSAAEDKGRAKKIGHKT
jgi:hypothetical protein